MAATSGEIVEVKDEWSWDNGSKKLQPSREHRPPIAKNSLYKPLENEIHELLQAVAPRACKSLDLSDAERNPFKKPVKLAGSMSPSVGFSEPVSLKQALRGLCISQAAEIAAIKRLSMTVSPRASDGVKVMNPRTFVVLEGGKSCSSQSMEGKIRAGNSRLSDGFREKGTTISMELGNLVAQESAAFCDGKAALRRYHEPKVKTTDGKAPSPKRPTRGLSHSSASSSNAADKAVTKVRRKPKLQATSTASVSKSSRGMKASRNAARAVKPAGRTRNVVVRKSKKSVTPTGAEFNSEHLICQKCQCSLRIENEDSPKTQMSATVAGTCKVGETKGQANPPLALMHGEPQLVKKNFVSKALEKGDISHSSMSSICEFSSSGTSLSEESSRSGSTCGYRPHMSTDLRWRAIDCITKKHGYLNLSHFSLLKKLGSGDIGTVYLAKLIGMDSLFAIKVMDNEFLAKRQKIPRAQTEGEILRMLDHPFLPTLYAQFTSDNMSCLVMEFCHGGDLHVLRQKQPGGHFAENEARFYVAEILLALEYLHMLGIVYRDLKPENILVREDGHIMLTDFDLSLRCSVNPSLVKSASEPARVSVQCAGSSCIDPFCTGPSCRVSCFTPRIFSTDGRTRKIKANMGEVGSLPQLVVEPKEARSNSFVGTHEYLAPEIIKGEGHGSAVDWWTFGVLLYELLYGKTPFKGSGNEETLSNIVLQSLEFPDVPLVSLQARDLIRRLLVKEPESRLGTETGAAEIKRHPFFEGLNWALIRCAVPPPVHEPYANGSVQVKSGHKFLFY